MSKIFTCSAPKISHLSNQIMQIRFKRKSLAWQAILFVLGIVICQFWWLCQYKDEFTNTGSPVIKVREPHNHECGWWLSHYHCCLYLSSVTLAGESTKVKAEMYGHGECVIISTFCISLTHWGWDKMATIFQMTVSSVFSWMRMYKFLLRFHLSLFFRVTSHCLSQWWLVCITQPRWITARPAEQSSQHFRQLWEM